MGNNFFIYLICNILFLKQTGGMQIQRNSVDLCLFLCGNIIFMHPIVWFDDFYEQNIDEAKSEVLILISYFTNLKF